MISVTVLLVLAAFVSLVVSVMGKCPLWVPLIFVVLILLLQVLPQ